MNRTKQPTSTYQAIWSIVRQIPKGRVATYGEIAKLSGLVGKSRLVGYALHNLPPNSNIPWHRVINSKGKISLPKKNGKYAQQKKLLSKERIIIKNEKIDFNKYGWLNVLDKNLQNRHY